MGICAGKTLAYCSCAGSGCSSPYRSCLLKVHLKDGVITAIEGGEMSSIPNCYCSLAPIRLPPLYLSKDAVTRVPPGIVGRDTLKLKPKTSEEAKRATQHDD